jgi:ubiquinone/menaquinone biosynthesis C-methylase UbiE
MNEFEQEQEKIRNEIWSLMNVENSLIIDVGVGENAKSTKTLIEKGAQVIAVDTSLKALEKHKDMDATLVCCNIVDMPFKTGIFDVIFFFFTLHEINPSLHDAIISQAALTSSQVVIVEPAPGNTPGYQRYEELWSEAMHAVGKYEDYQSQSYWEGLLQTHGFDLTLSMKIEQTLEVPFETREEMTRFTLGWFKEEGVPEKYIDKVENLLKYAEEDMKLSDITIVMGEKRIRP